MHNRADALSMTDGDSSNIRTIPVADMLEIIKLISKVEPLDVLLDKVASTIAKSFGIRSLVICVIDEKTGLFVPRALKGFPAETANAIRSHTYSLERKRNDFRDESRIDRRTYYSRAETRTEDTSDDMDYVADSSEISKKRQFPDDWHALDSMAFLMEDRLGNWIGWIEIEETEDGKVPQRDVINRIQLLADLTGIAIENSLMYDDAITAMNESQGYLDLIVHDIGNMISSLDYYLGRLESGGVLDPQSRTDLQKALSVSKNAASLINNVRRMSEVRSTECSFKEKYDLRDVMLKCVAALKRDFPQKDIVIGFDCPEGECAIMADGLVHDLFMNLLNNAVKFNPNPTAEVDITIRNGTGVWVVSVEDRGVGVPEDVKPTMFSRFAKRAEGVEGTGLGLSIVALLVERYNGVVTVKDRVTGDCAEGASFEVAFPKASSNNAGNHETSANGIYSDVK